MISLKEGEEGDQEPEYLINLLDVLDCTYSPNFPKIFLMLISGYHDEHLQIWALEIVQYDIMSDNQIRTHLSSVHNDVAGHFRVNRTLDALRKIPAVREAIKKEPLLVKGLRAKCRRYINECPTCQKHTFEKIVNRAQPFTVSEYSPMDTMMIDYIEGLPADSEGNNNVIVIVDCFSRFSILHATKTTKAEELARKLLYHASLFGFPCRLIRGPALISDLIQDLMAKWRPNTSKH